MRKAVKSAIKFGVAGGAVGFGVVLFLNPHLQESEADQRAAIEACAEQLPIQLQESKHNIPSACQNFGIGDFYLPPRQEFIDYESTRITSDAQLHKTTIKEAVVLGGGVFVLGAFVGYKMGKEPDLMYLLDYPETYIG